MKKSCCTLVFIFCTTLLIAQNKKVEKATKKNNWAFGLNVGNIVIDGDVPSQKKQLQFGTHFYKPFTKWFGLIIKYNYGNAKGQHWLYSENFAKNSAWNSKYAAPTRTSNGTLIYAYNNNGTLTPTSQSDYVYYNYKSTVQNIALSTQFTLPLPFSDPKVGVHLQLGIGALLYNTKINTLNGNTTYASQFKILANSTNQSKKDVLNKLKDIMDDSYETAAEKNGSESKLTKHLGLGISYKINKQFELGVEKTFTFIKSDLLDGQRWQEHAYGDAVITRDFDLLILNSIRFSYYF